MGVSSQAGARCAGSCIQSAHATYTPDGFIEANYSYPVTKVMSRKDPTAGDSGIPSLRATVETRQLRFRTQQRVPRVGVMLVGLGGNNGTTIVAGILANKKKMSWRTKCGTQHANWYGSLLMSGTLRLGSDAETGEDVHVPLQSMLPMLSPDDIVVGGWDISDAPLGDAMRRAAVLDIQLQDQLYSEMQTMKPLPGVYYSSFIAESQKERANNVLEGSMQDQLETLRENIRTFKRANQLEKVLVLWTATTERFCDVQENVHTTADALLNAVRSGDSSYDISPSTLYAMAALLEGCSFINGSPQNTLVPGVVELASRQGVFVGGDDFKSGQTKLKSVLVDFLVSAGIKPVSIVSYNHLGNNDGRNLDSYAQFRSKEISKSNVVDDMVESNAVLYEKGSKPDHCVVIKYVPYVGDSKRALDEYTSEIFLGGLNTISVHNTCEDSLLAAPIILDLILLTELCERIHIAVQQEGEAGPRYEKFHPVLSLLSYLCKAPLVPHGAPVVNALAAQRTCITNVLRACIGLPPESHMQLEYKVPSLLSERRT